MLFGEMHRYRLTSHHLSLSEHRQWPGHGAYYIVNIGRGMIRYRVADAVSEANTLLFRSIIE